MTVDLLLCSRLVLYSNLVRVVVFVENRLGAQCVLKREG